MFYVPGIKKKQKNKKGPLRAFIFGTPLCVKFLRRVQFVNVLFDACVWFLFSRF